MVIGERSNFDS